MISIHAKHEKECILEILIVPRLTLTNKFANSHPLELQSTQVWKTPLIDGSIISALGLRTLLKRESSESCHFIPVCHLYKSNSHEVTKDFEEKIT